ncbi:MAG: N-formylglutamate deformylase [Burkholderiales bacterium]|nr:N-formylglutamate deformylase [Burkholderiales bacterium]
MNTTRTDGAQATFTMHRGSAPLLVSVPHAGRSIPDVLKPAYVERALDVEDTDWHLDTLYAIARAIGASLIVPHYSRFVIDLNRPPDNLPMYPGSNNTELCPTRFFNGDAIYRDGGAPGAAQIAERLETYWWPYHNAIVAELARLKHIHAHAILWDGHSIKSELPWLFEGRLPDLNLGTASGTSCAPSLRALLAQTLKGQSEFGYVIDGRFKGGYITRHYGRPQEAVHAIQLEMCWSTYMTEAPPYTADPLRVARLQPVLRSLLTTLLVWKPDA